VNDFFRQHPSAAIELQLMTERALDATDTGQKPDREGGRV
jgi:hypothetical protein